MSVRGVLVAVISRCAAVTTIYLPHLATRRQRQVARLLAQGVRRRVVLARQLGVHPSTISRDVQALLALSPGACPICGRGYALAWIDDPFLFVP
jgi:DNA-binding CsgD family transcriptional regulator